MLQGKFHLLVAKDVSCIRVTAGLVLLMLNYYPMSQKFMRLESTNSSNCALHGGNHTCKGRFVNFGSLITPLLSMGTVLFLCTL